jgi:hypothetical protein
MLRRLLAIAWLVIALLGLTQAARASACGATGDGSWQSYDSTAVGCVGDGENVAVDAGLLPLGGQREASASPPTSAQYAGTTAGSAFVAPSSPGTRIAGELPPSSLGVADHHIFPQQWRTRFADAGVGIDQFTVPVDHDWTHLRGIYGKGLPNQGMPGRWNQRWSEFLDANPNATATDIYQFGGSLMDEFGLSGLPIHPYGKPGG